MKKYFALLLLILSTPLFAQIKLEVSSTKNLHILEGTIDNKYPITMYLTIDKNPPKADGKYYYNGIGYSTYFGEIVYGRYYYNNIKTPIYFGESIWGKQNRLILEEFTSKHNRDKSTGEFTGTLNKKMVFKGTWSNEKKSFDFEVKPNKKSKVQEIEIKKYAFEDTNYYSEGNKFGFSSEIFQIANPKKLAGIEKINKALELELIAATNNLDNEYLEWKKDVDASDERYSYGLGMYRSYEFVYSDNNIVVIGGRGVFDFGGASPSSGYIYLTYSLDSGEDLNAKIEDLVYSVDDDKFNTLVKQKLKARYNNSVYLDRLKSGGIYIVNDSEIMFLYRGSNKYPITITFTYEELKPFVKKSSPMRYLFE